MSQSPFVDYLESLSQDKAAMAALRRGLGKGGGDAAMYRYVVPFIPEKGHDAWRYFAVAALFGYHHDMLDSNNNVGQAMHELEQNDSLEKRFAWLVDSNVEDLPLRLKSIFSLLKSKKIGVDYRQLFKDLKHWEHPDRFVQLEWAKGFYTAAKTEEDKTK